MRPRLLGENQSIAGAAQRAAATRLAELTTLSAETCALLLFSCDGNVKAATQYASLGLLFNRNPLDLMADVPWWGVYTWREMCEAAIDGARATTKGNR